LESNGERVHGTAGKEGEGEYSCIYRMQNRRGMLSERFEWLMRRH
jgi:hypothetical protein